MERTMANRSLVSTPPRPDPTDLSRDGPSNELRAAEELQAFLQRGRALILDSARVQADFWEARVDQLEQQCAIARMVAYHDEGGDADVLARERQWRQRE